MVAFQAMIQLKVLGDGLNLWHNKPGAYWIKVPNQSTQRIVPISEKVTPLARQEQSRSLEELRERAWSLPWPIVEAAALFENKVAVIFAVVVVIKLPLHSSLVCMQFGHIILPCLPCTKSI